MISVQVLLPAFVSRNWPTDALVWWSTEDASGDVHAAVDRAIHHFANRCNCAIEDVLPTAIVFAGEEDIFDPETLLDEHGT